MRFLVDAQLPRRMATWLTGTGCDAVHTLDLPAGNRTTDEQINDLADREQRVVVSDETVSVQVSALISGADVAGMPMGELFHTIRQLVAEEKYVVGQHASERLEERGIME